MTRTISWMIGLAILVFVTAWLADRPGTLSLTWQGWRVDTSVAVLVLGVVVVAAATALIYRLWLAIRRAPGDFWTSRRGARRERGYRALTQGMVAVAAGDAAEAARQARRAQNLLEDPPLTMLLSAQAAQLSGDEDAARSYFQAMLERPETSFLGLRGLLMQAQRDGDEAAALAYARRAYELRPKTPWVLTTLFDLQVKEGAWREALLTLDEAMRRNAVGAAEGRRRRVVVLLGCSGEAEAAGHARDAMAYARKAYDQANEFTPAVLRLVALMVASGKARPASRIIHNAWARAPHPELARIYASIGPEQPLKRVQRLEKLLTFNPDHRESHIALAEAALEAELWGTARNHLGRAAGAAPSARVCRLMAELEERERGDMAAGRKWLLRVGGAEPDPSWVCAECGDATAAWSPLCANCGALGSLAWSVPSRPHGLVYRPPAEAAAAGPAPDAARGPSADAAAGPSEGAPAGPSDGAAEDAGAPAGPSDGAAEDAGAAKAAPVAGRDMAAAEDAGVIDGRAARR